MSTLLKKVKDFFQLELTEKLSEVADSSEVSYELTEKLSETSRGQGGFGSTGQRLFVTKYVIIINYLSLLITLYAYGIDFESNMLNEFNLIL